MTQVLTAGTMLQCSFGAAPSALMVLPANRVTVGGMPAANIADSKPMVNIMPFGMCMSMSNPTVIAATAAAMGVLTPMPCIPAVAAPWVPAGPKVTIANMPVVDTGAKCICSFGGNIAPVSAAQMTVVAN